MSESALRAEVCCNTGCGVPFSLPEHVYQQSRRLGKERTFYCPNGHAQVYQRTEEERLKERVASLERELADVRDSWAHDMKSLTYWRGMATRWKRKADR